MSFDILNTCLYEELFDKRLAVDVGSCFRGCRRRFDHVLTYNNWSLGYLYSLYVFSNNSDVTSKKSTICKFV